MLSTPRFRRVLFSATFAAVLCAAGLIVGAQSPQPVGAWAGVGAIDGVPNGAASVTLADGRTLVIGGVDSNGAASDAVLVYDPVINALSAAGQLLAPRVEHTATLLDDGRVLVAGGVVNGELSADLEMFDPSQGTSAPAGTLAQPRSGHAAARLPKGEVLIVGGATAAASASAEGEVVDPASGGTTILSSTLAEPRVGASATTLIDGRVLVAGGRNESGDLATAEVFEAYSQTFTPADTRLSVARSGHTAVLLPHNNSVLIAGGTSAGQAVSAADLFLTAQFPDPYYYGMGSFVAAAPMGAARTGAAGAPGDADGFAVVVGGGSADGERYRFATIKTDKDDYAPGELAVITGSGWQPGEEVTLLFQEDPAVHDDYVLRVTADEAGNIYWDQWAPEQHDFGVQFYLMASDSRSKAQTAFTDGNKVSFSTSANGAEVLDFGTLAPNVCFSVFVQERQGGPIDGGTHPARRVDLGSTPAGATFHKDAACSGGTNQTTFVTIPANQPAAQFWFKIGSTGAYTINGVGVGINGDPNNASATVTIGQAGPTKLAITSVNGGANPTFGTAFSLVVQAQNASNAATNVAANTAFSLDVATGTGVVGGTVSGTIPAGSNSVTVTGVTYSKAGTNVSLTATRTSGDSLTSGTSTLFDVLQAATTTTVTCPATAQVYTGTDIEPCSAAVSGPGLDEELTVTYVDNVNAGTATANASYAESENYLGSDDSENFTIGKAETVTTVTCGDGPFTYTGSKIEPCEATVSGPGLSDAPVTVTYVDNVNAGTATANASYAESENYLGSSDSENFTIGKAPTTTTVSCDPSGPLVYTGSPFTPCTATVTGPILNEPVQVTYDDNVNAGLVTASATYPESDNYLESSDFDTFTINKAPTTTTVSCDPPGPFVYTGNPFTPCTASVNGANMPSQPLDVSYSNNVDAGTATASASYAESANHLKSSDSVQFIIYKAPQVITFTSTPPDPFTLGSTYAVAATGGASGNSVVFSSLTPAVCSVTGNVVKSLAIGGCIVAADQAGSANYHAADQATQTFGTHYAFTGFFRPVDNLPVLNSVKAGSAIPLKFSLNGYQGMEIFALNSPFSAAVSCSADGGVDDVTETLTAGNSSLSYDAAADQYVYVWKTEKSWSNCRQLVVRLKDGKEYKANFLFKK